MNSEPPLTSPPPLEPQAIPLLEFDASREALIEPSRLIHPRDVPLHCVLCFFQEVISELSRQGKARRVACLRSEIGEHPLYELQLEGERVGLFHPGIGAPLAAGGLEELIALGCRKFIVCGGAGVLDSAIAMGHLIVPISAVRDEGTSFHYLPPSREVQADPVAVSAIEKTLQRRGIDFLLAKTWTTDAFYRETAAKIRLRKSEGCLTVEMEAAALFAVAQFRAVRLGQILYGGDDLGGAQWDSRNWHLGASRREQVFWLAAEACLVL